MKLHSIISLLVVIICLIIISIAPNMSVMLKLFSASLFYLFLAGLSLQRFVKILPIVLIFTMSYLLSFLIFAEIKITSVDDLISSKAFYIALRLFTTSLLSICSLSVIQHEVCILYFCQKKMLPAKIGYPLLFSLNSISQFKKQFELIRLNARLRRIKGWLLPHILFQLIVFSLRFSEKGALSLTTRRLSEQKDYYQRFDIPWQDWACFSLILIVLLALHLRFV